MNKMIISTLFLTSLISIQSFAADKPAKKDSATAKAAAVKTAASKTHALDTAASKVKWVGRKVVGPHHGTVNIKEGSVTLDGTKPTAGTFVIDMTTIKDEDLTDADYNKKLVTHLSSDDFFAVSKYPTSTFKVTNAVAGKDGEYTVTGDMTIKDITKSITFPVKVTESKGVYSATGKFKINRTDWGVKYNSGKFFDAKALGDKIINDEIEIELDLKTTGA
jgi:polyisoprenoid-binding protein YceI